MEQQTCFRVQQVELREVAGCRLDVGGDAVVVGEQVAGGRRAWRALERGQRVGDGLGVQDRAQQHVVRHPRLPPVRVGHEGVGGEADAGGRHACLREQAGLDDGDEVGPVVLAGLEHDDRVERVQKPIPVLPHERPLRARAWQRREGRALAQPCGDRLARTCREHHFRADVDREDVLERHACSFADPPQLLGVLRTVGLDRRLEPARLGGHPIPVPAREAGEHLTVGIDRETYAVARLLAVLATALAGCPLHRDVRVIRHRCEF